MHGTALTRAQRRPISNRSSRPGTLKDWLPGHGASRSRPRRRSRCAGWSGRPRRRRFIHRPRAGLRDNHASHRGRRHGLGWRLRRLGRSSLRRRRCNRRRSWGCARFGRDRRRCRRRHGRARWRFYFWSYSRRSCRSRRRRLYRGWWPGLWNNEPRGRCHSSRRRRFGRSYRCRGRSGHRCRRFLFNYGWRSDLTCGRNRRHRLLLAD